jgi:hypothetical protein
MTWLSKKLSDIAVIHSGVPFRTRVENEPEGQIAVIQARDIWDTGQVQLATAARVSSLPGSTEASLRSGDVLFQPRGTRFSAGVLVSLPMPVAAAAPLLVLRCDPAQIDPGFLVLFLQLPGTQAILKNAAVGTYIPQVPRQALAELLIDIPTLEHQRKLTEFDQITRREAELTSILSTKRERLLELAVRELAKKDRGRENAAGPEPVPGGVSAPSETTTKNHLRGEL